MAIYHYSIMILEDSPGDRLLYSHYLNQDQTATYDFIEAQSGLEALTQLEQSKPDLILLNYQLPDMDGWEFLNQLQLQFSDFQFPVIMLTRQEQEMVAVTAMENSVQDYILKEKITSTELCHTVHTVLEKNQLMQQIQMQERQQHLLAKISLRICQCLCLEEILQTAVAEIQEFLAVDRVVVYQFDSDMNGKIVAESVLPSWKACLGIQIRDTYFQATEGIAYSTGKIRAITDIYQAGLANCYINLLEQFQVKASLMVPILLNPEVREMGKKTLPRQVSQSSSRTTNNQLWGLLIVHQCSGTREWQKNELDLLQQISLQLTLASQQAELYQHLQQLNSSLESKVEQLTEKLEASEDKFPDHTSKFTALLTTEGILIEANQTALNFAGLLLEEVVNRPFWETEWWKTAPTTEHKLKQAIPRAAQGEIIRYELDILGIAGEIASIDFCLRPLTNQSGEVLMLIAEGQYMQQQKYQQNQNQASLENFKASETELQGIFHAMVDIIMILDRQGRYLKIAPSSLDQLYLPAEELLGKTVHEIFPPHLADLCVSIIDQAITTQQTLECEYKLNIDEQEMWFRARVSPISSETVIWVARDISEARDNAIIHEQTKQAFEESQILLQMVMDSLPMAIFWKDRNGYFLGCNRQLVLDAGLSSPEQIIGKTDWDMPWQEQAALYQQQDQIVIKSGEPKFNIEQPMTKSGNLHKLLSTNKIPLQNFDGEIIGVLGSYEDITERRQMEQALQESEGRYETLASSAPVGIYRADVAGDYLYVNPKWCEITGLTFPQAIGSGWKQALHTQDLSLVEEEWNHLITTGETFSLEYRFQQSDTVEIWVFAQAVPEINLEGIITGYVGTITNITQHKKSEQALKESEEKFRQFAENSRSVMLLRQVESGELLFINPAYQEIWGQSNQSLYENPTSWMNFIHPDDQESVYANYEASSGKNFLNQEYRIIRPDGSIRWIWGRCFPIHNSAGELYRIGAIAEDITNRKQTEQERDRLMKVLAAQNENLEAQISQRTAELQESEKRFRNLVEASSDWLWEVDVSGIYTYASPQIINILGYSPAEIVGKTPFDLMPPAEAERVLAEFMKFISIQAPFQCLENTNQHKDGRLITLETSGVPIFDEHRKFRGYRGIDRDITVRKQIEIALRNLSQRLDLAIQSAQIGIWDWDMVENKLIWDERMYKIYGVKPSDFTGAYEAWEATLHPDDILSSRIAIQQAITGENDFESEFRIIWPDQTIRYLKAHSYIQRDSEGKAERMIGINFDITERKLAEAEIIRSRDLREAIFNESADALFLVDIETVTTVDCNQRAVEMFAAQNKSDLIGIQGHTLQKQQYTPEEIKAIMAEMSIQGVWSQEIEYKTFTGELFWGNLAAKEITIGDQKMNLVRVTDISQRKLAETQLQQTNQQLATSNAELARATRLKDEFLATMSHELRTPLNAILGISEGLQEQVFGIINDKQRQGLETIERSGKHLLELINDILDLSKIEAGQLKLECNYVPVANLCQFSLTFIQQQAFQKHIQLEVNIQPHLPELLLDERRMRQVLINLLNNAVKFTPEGGQITLTATREKTVPESKITSSPDLIRIAVIDTGIGIAPENIQKLFQPFVQIDSALNRKYTGTGLGLALVKRLVEIHGGQVSVTSELGVGSRFTVDLPCSHVYESSSELVNQESSNVESIFQSTADKSPLILLAEDNEANIFTISNYLEATGYRMILAKTGQEAIDLSKSHKPDLILMDVQMPLVSGLEAIKQIRLDTKLINIPIIALTALAMPGDREKCLAAGANHYLSKPVKLKQLVMTIKQFLNPE